MEASTAFRTIFAPKTFRTDAESGNTFFGMCLASPCSPLTARVTWLFPLSAILVFAFVLCLYRTAPVAWLNHNLKLITSNCWHVRLWRHFKRFNHFLSDTTFLFIWASLKCKNALISNFINYFNLGAQVYLNVMISTFHLKKKINVDLNEIGAMKAKLKLFIPFPFQSQDYIFLSKAL